MGHICPRQWCLGILYCAHCILPEIIDEEPGPDEVVEVLHDGAGQEQHALPLSHVHHLTLCPSRLSSVWPVVGSFFKFWPVIGASGGGPVVGASGGALFQILASDRGQWRGASSKGQWWGPF